MGERAVATVVKEPHLVEERDAWYQIVEVRGKGRAGWQESTPWESTPGMKRLS